MEPRGGMGESSARVGSNATPAPRAKRKKARPTTAPAPAATSSQANTLRPIPQPYLALAPKPISSYSRSRLDEQQPISSNLVLPSSFRRPTTVRATSSGDAGPSTIRNTRERERERFANGLLAPPAIRAGGTSRNKNRPVSPSGNNNTAATSGGNGATNTTRRRQADRAAGTRGLGAGNPSMTSLGHLGRILEADPTLNTVAEERPNGQVGNPPTTRRRRRIVRGDEDSPGVERRLTVSSREEGRALGLARGASMRRLNVWDDLPENNDAPPPFPFPTTSTSRLPPTFQSTEPPVSSPTSQTVPVPNSPPPTFEQATGLHPLPSTGLSALPPTDDPTNPTDQADPEDTADRPVSRASVSTRYESAPSSPVLTALDSGDDTGELTQEERSDRRMWNADLLAGYTLSERVERELARKRARENAGTVPDRGVTLPIVEEREEPETVPEAVEPATEAGPAAETGPSETVALPVQSPVEPVAQESTIPPTTSQEPEVERNTEQPTDTRSVPEHEENPEEPPTPIAKESKGKRKAIAESATPSTPGSAPTISSSEQAPSGPSTSTTQSPKPDTKSEVEQIRAVPESIVEQPSSSAIPEVEKQSKPTPKEDDADATPKPTPKRRSRKNKRKSSVSAPPKPAGDATTERSGDVTPRAVVEVDTRPKFVEMGIETTKASSDSIEQPVVQVAPVPAIQPPAVPAKSSPPAPTTKEAPIRQPEQSEGLPKPAQIRETSTRSLHTLSEGIESPTSISRNATPTPANQNTDTVFGNPAPTRKLTRGKAIRRSSSGLIKDSSSPTASAPLFSASRFDFGKSTITASPVSSPPLESPRTFIHRSSAPEVPRVQSQASLQEPVRQARKSEDRGSGAGVGVGSAGGTASGTGFKLIGGRRLGDPTPSLATTETQKVGKEDKEELIPPHREAALLRRESILAQRSRPATIATSAPAPAPATVVPTVPTAAKSIPVPAPARIPPGRAVPISSSPQSNEKRASLPSGPLIDFSDFHDAGLAAPYPYPASSPGSSHGFMSLATANAELLQLLEEEAGQPESSSQAAAKAELVKDIQANLAHPQERPESPEFGLTIDIDTQSRTSGKAPMQVPTLPPRHLSTGLGVPRTQSLRTGLGEDDPGRLQELQNAIKKKPPPPPPPLRNRKDWTAGQKISIVDTATSPITPRPSLRRPPQPPQVPPKDRDGSPTKASSRPPAPPPPLPTRRPPPPPPAASSPGSSRDDIDLGEQQTQTPPPLFTRRSEGHGIRGRPLSSTSMASDASSLFDQQSHSTIAPLPTPTRRPLEGNDNGWKQKQKRFDRSPVRPRGPRPPPPPPRPRTWAKIASDSASNSISTPFDGPRPSNDRTHSAGILAIHTHGEMDSPSPVSSARSPIRSTSEQNLTSAGAAAVRRAQGQGQGQGPRSPEYTDLDVFVSRLEGSGREYEGYSQIAQFLGPAKSPAASREALATLLPGPILVESRRLTKEGKTKLKLSLLGVRVTKCPICLAQFREGEMGVIVPGCGHLGHETCVRRWFREDDRCFVCRDRLKVEEGVV